MLYLQVRPVSETTTNRGRGDLSDDRDLTGLHLRELGEWVRHRQVQSGYTHAARGEERREHRHHASAFGDQISPVDRARGDQEARENQGHAERRRDRAEDYADSKRYCPEVQPDRWALRSR